MSILAYPGHHGVGSAFFLLSLKSGINAWTRYKRLTPTEIARMNGVLLDFGSPDKNMMKDGRVDAELLRKFQQYPGGFLPKLTENEACLILNISNEEILRLDENMLKKKHRKCIILNHPDRGGSPYIAMKINTAKEVLMDSYILKK